MHTAVRTVTHGWQEIKIHNSWQKQTSTAGGLGAGQVGGRSAKETNLQRIDTEIEVIPFPIRERLAHFETRKCLNEFVFQKRADNREYELEVVRKQLGL